MEDLITLYMKTKYIDVSRIYICGASMGACGVWKLLKDNPKLFTAAIIASGQAQRAYPSDFTGIPLYVTVGSEERSYEALKWFSSEIEKAGGMVQFDVLLGQRLAMRVIMHLLQSVSNGFFRRKKASSKFELSASSTANKITPPPQSILGADFNTASSGS